MIKDTEKKIKENIQEKGLAYSRVFSQENQFTDTVLQDLAKFCRAYETTFHPDPRVHAALEGRREVWLRISEYLNLAADEIYRLHIIRKGERS